MVSDLKKLVYILSYDSEIRGGNKLDKSFMDIVDKIISAKKQDPQADVSKLEREIDKMVYELYGLSDEEVNIIERGL